MELMEGTCGDIFISISFADRLEDILFPLEASFLAVLEKEFLSREGTDD